MNSVQDKTWKALRTQEVIENWAERIESLTDILDSITEALDTLATFYSPFEDEAKAAHGLVTAVDGIQIIPKVIKLGLEIDCVDTLGNRAELPQAVFGEI